MGIQFSGEIASLHILYARFHNAAVHHHFLYTEYFQPLLQVTFDALTLRLGICQQINFSQRINLYPCLDGA